MKTIIIRALLMAGALAVVIGLAWLGSSQTGAPTESGSPQTASVLAAAETTYQFGTVSMAKGKVSHKFTITNPTDKPVVVTKVYTSCMCTQAMFSVGGKSVGPFGMPGHVSIPKISVEIPAGGQAELEGIFDPAAHGPAGVGHIERELYIETDGTAPLVINFSADVTP